MRRELRRLVKRLGLTGRVTFAGAQPQALLSRYYQEAAFVVLPSVSEGAPLVLIEALSSGKPVIATSLKGIASIVHHGENGLLVPPGDVRALADALDELAGNDSLYGRLASRSAISVRDRFSWHHISRQIHVMYVETSSARGADDPAALLPIKTRKAARLIPFAAGRLSVKSETGYRKLSRGIATAAREPEIVAPGPGSPFRNRGSPFRRRRTCMPETPPPVVVVLIDAFRHDFITEDVTPNLAGLAAVGVQLPLRPILGYSDAIRATFFTGRYPDETGYWMEYCYRPETSPWQGSERFAFVDRVPLNAAVRGAKMATSMTLMRALARQRGVPHLDIRNMPLKAAGKFDFTLSQPMTAPHALGYPSIFDACTAAGRLWAYLDASKARRGSDLLDQVSGLPERRRPYLRLPASGRHGRTPVRNHVEAVLAARALHRCPARADSVQSAFPFRRRQPADLL